MSLDNARKFVEKMKKDQDFRNRAAQAEGQENLFSLLQAEGFIFDQVDLVGAMAECMEQLDLQMAQ